MFLTFFQKHRFCFKRIVFFNCTEIKTISFLTDFLQVLEILSNLRTRINWAFRRLTGRKNIFKKCRYLFIIKSTNILYYEKKILHIYQIESSLPTLNIALTMLMNQTPGFLSQNRASLSEMFFSLFKSYQILF